MMGERHNLKTVQYPGSGQVEFIVPVDIVEGNKGFRLLFMLPGVEPDQVSVDVDGTILTISGERRYPALEEGERLESVESHYGFFRRQFKIPAQTDADAIAARYDAGILEIAIPKMDVSPARTIPITAADG